MVIVQKIICVDRVCRIPKLVSKSLFTFIVICRFYVYFHACTHYILAIHLWNNSLLKHVLTLSYLSLTVIYLAEHALKKLLVLFLLWFFPSNRFEKLAVYLLLFFFFENKSLFVYSWEKLKLKYWIIFVLLIMWHFYSSVLHGYNNTLQCSFQNLFQPKILLFDEITRHSK